MSDTLKTSLSGSLPKPPGGSCRTDLGQQRFFRHRLAEIQSQAAWSPCEPKGLGRPLAINKKGGLCYTTLHHRPSCLSAEELCRDILGRGTKEKLISKMEQVRRAGWIEDFLLWGKVKAFFPQMKILVFFINHRNSFLSGFNHNDSCRPFHIIFSLLLYVY